MAMIITEPDLMTSLQNAVVKRIINAGIFESSEIQRSNMAAPDALPYCRVTVISSGDWDGASQRRIEKTVIAEFDVFTRIMQNTQQARGLASAIEREFGIDHDQSAKRTITLPSWIGVECAVETFSRGAEYEEEDRGLYTVPVMLYLKVTVLPNKEYIGA